MMAEVQRYDVVKLDSPRTKTHQGFLRTTGRLTRVGVLTYQTPDGPRRELRPPDEVFDAKSLASLASAPITDLHPEHMVSSSNHKSVSVGFVGESVKNDAKYVTGSMTFTDAAVIEKIDSGERTELSPGYRCQMDNTPGTYNGQKYDAIQRDIRYNHLAILPEGAGRSGSEVRIDGEDWQLSAEPLQEEQTMKFDIDGIPYEGDSIPAALDRYTEKCDSAVRTLKTKNEELKAKVDAVTAERDETKAKLDAATDPKVMSEKVASRVSLEVKARKLLGEEAKFDGKTDKELKLMVLAKTDDGKDFADKSDSYLDAYFDIASERAPVKDPGVAGVLTAVPTGKPEEDKVDADEPKKGTRAYMKEVNRLAWTKPTTITKRQA